jgi:LysR family transcriptional regulator, glycine cleavage system transcriptional activator
VQIRNLPLGFLPTFEAAGRLGSFKAAAAEVHLTPSAVGQQMRLLEEALGVALFERRGRGLLLTGDGERYLRDVRESLRRLAAAGGRAQRSFGAEVLRLSTAPLIAHEFLLPRLRSFRARFPGVDLHVEATMGLVDFEHSDIDAAIRVGGGPWPGLVTKPFGSVVAAPICAPMLAERIRCPADLEGQTLIEVRGQEHRSFTPLMKAHTISTERSERLSFETCLETARAAEHGLGVSLALFPLVTSWIVTGKVAVPLPLRAELPGHISLVYRPQDEARFPFAALGHWLEEQYAALPRLVEGRVLHA